jgi:hypothetical protein
MAGDQYLDEDYEELHAAEIPQRHYSDTPQSPFDGESEEEEVGDSSMDDIQDSMVDNHTSQEVGARGKKKKKDKKLVFLSRSVLKKIRERPMTTGTQIANEILELYKRFSNVKLYSLFSINPVK